MAKLIIVALALVSVALALADKKAGDLATSEARRSYSDGENYSAENTDAQYPSSSSSSSGSAPSTGSSSGSSYQSSPKTKKTVILAIPVKLALNQPGQERPQPSAAASSYGNKITRFIDGPRPSSSSSSSFSAESGEQPSYKEYKSPSYATSQEKSYDSPKSSYNDGPKGYDSQAPAQRPYESRQQESREYDSQVRPSYGRSQSSATYNDRPSSGANNYNERPSSAASHYHERPASYQGHDQGQDSYSSSRERPSSSSYEEISYADQGPSYGGNSQGSYSQGSYSESGPSKGSYESRPSRPTYHAQEPASYSHEQIYPEATLRPSYGPGKVHGGQEKRRPSYGNQYEEASASYGSDKGHAYSGLNAEDFAGLEGFSGSLSGDLAKYAGAANAYSLEQDAALAGAYGNEALAGYPAQGGLEGYGGGGDFSGQASFGASAQGPYGSGAQGPFPGVQGMPSSGLSYGPGPAGMPLRPSGGFGGPMFPKPSGLRPSYGPGSPAGYPSSPYTRVSSL
ncbi:hypothetical protein HDE_10380 [Halotydeus destructor]|nr:hypothetical protein HDE_10380 [Halotydeus destructor]